MDPVTGTALSKAADATLEQVKPLVQKLFGPAFDELGGVLADKLKVWRFGKQLLLLQRAKEKLDAAGVEPQAVNVKVLLPLIEAAVLDDNDDLCEMWASLLANAATPAGARTHPSFVSMLRELTLVETQFVERLHAAEVESPKVAASIRLATLAEATGSTPEQAILATSVLVRAEICYVHGRLDVFSPQLRPERFMFPQHQGKMGRPATYLIRPARPTNELADIHVRFSVLGREFARACHYSPDQHGGVQDG